MNSVFSTTFLPTPLCNSVTWLNCDNDLIAYTLPVNDALENHILLGFPGSSSQ